MQYSDYIIYVDESGDHGLRSIDPHYPIFVLNFCIFEKQAYVEQVVPQFQAFKFRHFGHDQVILHERSIRNQEPPFFFLCNQSRRQVFMAELSRIIEAMPVTMIAAVIDKRKLNRTYPDPANPYELALLFCMERAYLFLKERGQHQHPTYIVAESRGKREDSELETAFRHFCCEWNYLQERFNFVLEFADKQRNAAGLQLADLTARPIGLSVLRPHQPNRAWDVIRGKLRTGPTGRIDGYGLKVFP